MRGHFRENMGYIFYALFGDVEEQDQGMENIYGHPIWFPIIVSLIVFSPFIIFIIYKLSK